MSAPRLSAGGVIAGKYTVRNMLGNGGAVITYHCVNQQGQEVAVKLYDPAVASHQTVMKSLEQAYATTNALPQNSSAPIIDAGYDPPTVAPFSVTELLRLPSLSGQQRRLPPEEVVTLLKGLARSLDLAHVRGVVHGAIKPTNVFCGPAQNPVIVTDFAANLPKAAFPTQEGFISSAPWIAPEQAQSGNVTPAADVFSVGLLVFYALTGRPYWRSTQGTQFDLAGWQQELGQARTPASARAAELGVPLSPSLDMVIWKAISADPQERFKSIGEFASTLEDSFRQQVGSAATMALPMVGDAPSPLPADMRNPNGPRPNSGAMPPNKNAATMALPMEQFMPPGGQMPGPMGQGGQMGGPMGQPQMDAYGQPMGGQSMGGPQGYGQMGQPQQQMGAYGQPQMGGPGMGGPGVPQAAPSQNGNFAYAQGREGYPPPPQPITPLPEKKSKLPIVIGFVAVALIGLLGTFVFIKIRDDKAAYDPNAPVVVGTDSATATAAPTPAPTPTPPPTTAPSGSSSAAAAKEIEVKIECKPQACDEIKIDGKPVDLKKPIMLTPGPHEVEVTKAGFVGQTEKLEVKDGPPMKKSFTLQAEKAATPTPPTTQTAPKPPTTGPTKPPCKKGGVIKKC